MIANINPKTGIAYGYIAANALDQDLVDELLRGSQATDLDYESWEKEHTGDDGELLPDAGEYENDEPTISGTFEGVEYLTSYLGGALNFFIFYSPVITDKAGRASPCVPNAGILDVLNGDVTSYDVPSDWRYVDSNDWGDNLPAQDKDRERFGAP